MSEQNPQVVTTPRASTGDEDRSVTIPARPARRREQKPTDLSAASRAVAATPAMPATVTASTGSAVPPAAPSTAVPKHQRLSRRVMFLEQGQETGLAELTRQVMSDPRRAAVPGSARERISDAVLVRAAIDLLLRDHPAESLGCLTEDDLRASLGLPPLGR